MSCRDLRRFDDYKARIKSYAKAIGIKIIYKRMESEGVYVPSKRSVWIDVDLEDSEEIASLLHELGHAMDDYLTHFQSLTRLNQAYEAIYSPRYTRNQLMLVLDCEKRAWKYGRVIAKMIKIPLGKWYTSFQRESIATYRELK